MSYFEFKCNKKVLLRERKSHTARHVASARYAALSPEGGRGYPIQSWTRGYPIQSWMEGGGTPSQVWTGRVPHPVLDRGSKNPIPGLDGGGYPIQSWIGGTPEYPPIWTWNGVPPPCLDLGWVPPLSAGWGTPSPESWTDTHL